MEDKLKRVLDTFDENETDMLLKDITECDTELDADRIMQQVYEKTGVTSRKVIPWKKICTVAGLAACFALVFLGGYMLRGSITDNEMDGAASQYADVAEDAAEGDEPAVGDDMLSYAGDDSQEEQTGNTDDMSSDDSDSSGESSDTDSDKDEKKHKGNKKDSSSHGHQDSKVDNVAVGTDIDGLYLNMTSEEIDNMLAESAEDTDMDEEIWGYASLDDMINHVDYVVRGVKISSVFKKGSKKGYYNLNARFRVDNVIYNNSGEDIKDDITVEEGIIYKSRKEKYTHVYGYNKMKTGNEYLLFIKKSGDVYTIAETIFGKVPADPHEDVLHLEEDYIPSQCVMNAKNIIKAAREKYIDSSGSGRQEDKNNNGDKIDKPDKTDKTAGNNDITENDKKPEDTDTIEYTPDIPENADAN